MQSALIKARDLGKRFGSHVALDRVSFDVQPGRIVGLIGPNGAGKTTALRAVLGLTSYEGSLEVLGVPYTGSGVMGSAIGMDKWRTKMVWIANRLPTPRYRILGANDVQQFRIVIGARALETLPRELVHRGDVRRTRALYGVGAGHVDDDGRNV